MMRALALAASLVLAGCSTLPDTPTMDRPGVMCTLVSTLTTTVRTVFVQGTERPVSVGPDCSVAVL